MWMLNTLLSEMDGNSIGKAADAFLLLSSHLDFVSSVSYYNILHKKCIINICNTLLPTDLGLKKKQERKKHLPHFLLSIWTCGSKKISTTGDLTIWL